jgi:hypothetical protein
VSADPRPAEATVVHTRILRCTLAPDDCYAYWRNVDPGVPPSERAPIAFRERWFGVKSEARVRTLVPDMVERFDSYPSALALLRALGPIPSRLRPLLCHVHVQLADPVYRRFTGELLPRRRREGYRTIDRDTVVRWVDELEPGRWGAATRIKFASNLLAAAHEVGLVGSTRDPRPLVVPFVPEVVLGYVLYLLREVRFEGTLVDNPYLRSLGVEGDAPSVALARVPGVRLAELGGARELTFLQPSLLAYGLQNLKEAA